MPSGQTDYMIHLLISIKIKILRTERLIVIYLADILNEANQITTGVCWGRTERRLETWSEGIVSWLLSQYAVADWNWEIRFFSPVSCYPSWRQAAEHDVDAYRCCFCCSCTSLVWASPVKDYFCWLLWALGGPWICSFDKSWCFWQANVLFKVTAWCNCCMSFMISFKYSKCFNCSLITSSFWWRSPLHQ